MADYVADYTRYLTEEKRAQANTVNSYVRDLNQFRTWLMSTGATDLRRVRKENVDAYMQYMSSKGKSPATITRSAASIRSFYQDMLQRGAVRQNTAKAVAAVKFDGGPTPID